MLQSLGRKGNLLLKLGNLFLKLFTQSNLIIFFFFYYSNLEVTFILRDEDNVGVDPSVFKRFVREEIEEEEEEGQEGKLFPIPN